MADLPKLITDHRIVSANQLLVYLADHGQVSDFDRWRSRSLRIWLKHLASAGFITITDADNTAHHIITLTDKGLASVARATAKT